MYRSLLLIAGFYLTACSVSKQISKQATSLVLNDSSTMGAHIGICIYEPSTRKYWFQYQADKYFVPASNTKLFSLFAGLKYLGDSLPGIGYFEKVDTLYIDPTGDPTFLHPDFKDQRVYDFLKSKRMPIIINSKAWRSNALGGGWAWDDYNENYMVERSPMPIYGNLIKWTQEVSPGRTDGFGAEGIVVYAVPDVTWKINMVYDSSRNTFDVIRDRSRNIYEIRFGKEKRKTIEMPFVTDGTNTVAELLSDTLGKAVITNPLNVKFRQIYSRPVDSMYKIMMHRSDNFFAEQTLMMASVVKLGYMDERRLISTLLKNELKDLPQVPKWVDGSGLSRYNLFTPNDFVFLLNKMKDDYGLNRLKGILATGGKGTLTQYYIKDSSFIFAKTGTLSNHVALSGYLITKQNKLLVFSIMVNHHQSGAAAVRRAIEKFLSGIRQHY